jgi:transcriptional regulator with XRE-family HTH domain
VSLQEFQELFGRRLRQLRTRKRWSREKLANETGLSPNFIYYLERGESAASFETLLKLSEAFEIPAQSLFDFSKIPEDH